MLASVRPRGTAHPRAELTNLADLPLRHVPVQCAEHGSGRVDRSDRRDCAALVLNLVQELVRGAIPM
jgi:hypothetical protein